MDTTTEGNNRDKIVQFNLSAFQCYREAFERQLRGVITNLQSRRWWHSKKTNARKDHFLDSRVDYIGFSNGNGLNNLLQLASYMGHDGYRWEYNRVLDKWCFLPRNPEEVPVSKLNFHQGLVLLLEDTVGVHNAGELKQVSMAILRDEYGVYGKELISISHALAQIGIDWQ